MKFFLAIALIATVASAAIIKPTPVGSEAAEIQEIIAAIQSPSTDPATAAALEALLYDILGMTPEPVAVGPAIVEEPVHVGPAIIDFVHEEPVAVVPSPVIIGDIPEGSPAPLVQIIVKINNQPEAIAVGPEPVILPAPVVLPAPVILPAIIPTPVQVVDSVSPVQVVEPATPVHVVDAAPVAPEAVVIGNPVLPSPVVVLPEELN